VVDRRRREAATQYAAAFRFIANASGILGPPLSRRTTTVVDRRRREAAGATRYCHRPARPGDPVRRGLSIHLERLWNTGSPAFAEDDNRGGSTPQRGRRRNALLSSHGSTGRPSTPRPLDSSRTPLEYWVPRFRGGRQPWWIDAAERPPAQRAIVIARLDRATQYAAASRFISNVSGILGPPLSRRTTTVVDRRYTPSPLSNLRIKIDPVWIVFFDQRDLPGARPFL